MTEIEWGIVFLDVQKFTTKQIFQISTFIGVHQLLTVAKQAIANINKLIKKNWKQKTLKKPKKKTT